MSTGLSIKDVEEIVDNSFYKNKVPSLVYDVALWHVLTVYEDLLRMVYAEVVDKPASGFLLLIDEGKYSLRHCLRRLDEECRKSKIKLPAETVSDFYKVSFQLFVAGCEYERLCRVFGSVYSGEAKLEFVDGECEVKIIHEYDSGYSVLEHFYHGKEISADITTLLHKMFTDPGDMEWVIKRVAENGKLKKRRVIYSYDVELMARLAEFIPQREEVFPEGFEFQWGGAYHTHTLINSLLIRCFYHVLAVQVVASERNLKGGADSSLVLRIKRDELCNDLGCFADVDRKNIEKFVDYITYGVSTKTPDPALQPIFRTSSEFLLVPCYLILTSNCQRNLFSLMTRVSSREFSRQSKLFEEKMVLDIENMLDGWATFYCNKELVVGDEFEEIDILLLDEKERTALVVELKWALQPGDSREVMNKVKECKSKVFQTKRKVDFVRDNLNSILSILTEEKNEDGWSVFGMLVIEGFGGCLSPLPDIPMTTMGVFKSGIKNKESVSKLYRWIHSLEWLPKEGVDYERDKESFDLGEVVVHRPVISIKRTPKEYVESYC